MSRVIITVTKPYDLAQLDSELGNHGLCGSETQIATADDSPVTHEQLVSAYKTHVPVTVMPSVADKLIALGIDPVELKEFTKV